MKKLTALLVALIVAALLYPFDLIAQDQTEWASVARAAVTYMITDTEEMGYSVDTYDVRLDSTVVRNPLPPEIHQEIADDLQLKTRRRPWRDDVSCPADVGKHLTEGCVGPPDTIFLGVGTPRVNGDTARIRVGAVLPNSEGHVWIKVLDLELVQEHRKWTVARVMYTERS